MSSRVLTRVLLAVLAGALCGVAVACGLLVFRGTDGTDGSGPAEPATGPAASAPPAGERTARTARPVRSTAREVLRRWDDARARAWRAGDTAALARLYTRRSVAGERDVTMLRAWTERGARVTDLTTQVLRLQVLAEHERRLELVVTDRVAEARASGVAATTLPRDRPTTRRIVLVRAGGAWRVASVSPASSARS